MPDAPTDPRCLFCRIVAGIESAHLVFQDDTLIAFLDIRPLFAGHTLVVPRAHYETLADLPEHLIQPVFELAQRISAVIPDVLGAEGSFVAVNNKVSQSVPHLHVHVVPRTKGDGLRGFFWPRTKYSSDTDAAAVALRLRTALQ